MTAASMPRHLSDHHRQQLVAGSGIPDEVVSERGYWSATSKAELKRLGFADLQCNTPALVVPLHNVLGEISGYQIRPDVPRIKHGKALKYESPAGSRPAIDVPLRVRSLLGDPSVPLWITEGAKKADAAAGRGLCCLSIQGVWGWRGTNSTGGSTALADWETIALKSRTVILAFDSDVTVKPQVLKALARLVAFLGSRGATTRICLLSGTSVEKVGLDDFFVAGGTVEQLEDCIQPHLPAAPREPEERWAGPYIGRPSGITWVKETKDGEVEVPLTNFDARIISDVSRDDGLTVTREFEIEATLANEPHCFTVPAEKFRLLDWVPQLLGAKALVEPSAGSQARTPHAIQSLSEPASRIVYAHTGWRQIDGKWSFLHAGGALGQDGPVANVEVSLSVQLGLCLLAAADDIAAAVGESLRFLDVAPRRITWPLLIACYRATLSACDVSIFIEGLTGTRKTAMAALIQQHFGSGFDTDHLPGNWTSTANAIEELLFECKDVPCVIDDFVAGAGNERGKLDAAADRALRNVANQAARQRMRSDGSMRPARPPRALAIVTGEFLPSGHSLRARMVVVGVGPNDVDLAILTEVQRSAASGMLTAAMAAFIRWLAPRLESVQHEFRARANQLRDGFQAYGWHGRTVMNIAQLLAAGEILLQFAHHVGAVDDQQHTELSQDCQKMLIELGEAQHQHLRDADPVDQFFLLLRSALAGGLAHLRPTEAPTPPPGFEHRFGWDRVADCWSPRGQHIGYIKDESVYLHPDLVDSVVQALGRQRGDALQLMGPALRRRLDDRGKLASVEGRGGKKRLLRRITVDGVRHDVLHLHLADVIPSAREVAHVAQTDASTDSEGDKDGTPDSEGCPPVSPTEPGSGPEVVSEGTPGPLSFGRVAQRNQGRNNHLRPVGPLGTPADGMERPSDGPKHACFVCRGQAYWRAASGPWVCSRCHPPADGRSAWMWDSRTGKCAPSSPTPHSPEVQS